MIPGNERPSSHGYRAIGDELRNRIAAGEFVPGSYLPTERELQSRYATSRTTIRRALALLVETGWAQALPGRGVVAARGYRKATDRRVAFIDSNSVVAQRIRGVLEHPLRELGLEAVRIESAGCPSMEDSLRQAIEGEFAAAFVWSYEGFPDPNLVARAHRHLPIIALDHRLEGVDCDVVSFDYEAAAFEATQHLARNGARRIGVVGMLDMLEITHARFRGYLRGMFANGLQPLPKDFLFVATSGHDTADTAELERCFRSGDRPDALVILQDSYVDDTVRTALRAGLFLPSDLKLATLGDEFGASVDGMEITAVAFDWDALAQEGLQLLVARLEDLHRPPVHRLSPHSLRIRGLSGAGPSTWTDASSDRMVRHYTSRWSETPPP